MSYQDAEVRFASLQAQLAAGQVTPEQFQAAVNELRVQDPQGTWWQMSSAGGWLRWNGQAWEPAQRPGAGAAEARAELDAVAASGEKKVQEAYAELRQKTMAPDEFVQETQAVPVGQRSQRWWDSFSILGGATCAYAWLAYSSIAGMPLPKFMQSRGYVSVWDFVLLAAFAALPILAWRQKQSVASRLAPLFTKLRALTSAARLIALVASLAVGWWLQTGVIGYGTEGMDLLTPALMIALPILTLLFRPHIDRLLMPLQPLRRSIPRPLLMVLALAAPYGIAFLLYRSGTSQYPLMHRTLFLGTIVSYALMRNPQGPVAPRAAMAGLLMFWVGILYMACTGDAWADDFLTDPFNLNDGLRTDNVAPILAATPTAVITMIINGKEVAQTILTGTPKGPDEGPAERASFQVMVDTIDALGRPSTDLESGGNERIYIYAHCAKAGAPFPAGDPTIHFAGGFDTRWASLQDSGTAHGRRCAVVTLANPLPEGDPPPTLLVTVSAGSDGLISAPVVLNLKTSEYKLELR